MTTVVDPLTSLLFSPDLYASLVISQHTKSPLRFHCYSPVRRRIELWTNLLQNGDWSGVRFMQQTGSETDYVLYVNTFCLPPGKYEYTLRFSAPLDSGNDYAEDKDPHWFWYGKPNHNGCIHIVQTKHDTPTAPLLASVPQLQFVANKKAYFAEFPLFLWHFKTRFGAEQVFSLGKLDHPIHRYVCLLQKGSAWITPVTGAGNFQDRNASEKCQMLLYQDAEHGDIHLWMALCHHADCYFSFEADDSIALHHRSDKNESHLLIVSTSSKEKQVAPLICTALDYYQDSIKQPPKKKKADNPEAPPDTNKVLMEALGYCTWNAFGQDVDIYKVHSALDSLKTHKIPVRYLLLDDGWQSVTNEKRQMASFEACTSKFPGGLSKTVTRLKREYPFVQHIGVWHALWGYWNGIDREFAINNGYHWSLAINSHNQQNVGLIDDPNRLYDKFYQFLSRSGIDYVKVDNQGSFQELLATNDDHGYTALWDKFRQAMVNSGDVFFQGHIMNCMSLAPHVLFEPILSQKRLSTFRNSDDYFPHEKDSHSWHIYVNAINSLLTIPCYHPATPDWDMFQSDHPFAEYHASSRAISGGPIYITDPPHRHNVELIYKLVAETKHSGYTILRSSQAPQPTFETVFNTRMDSHSIIALYNVHLEQPRGTNQTPAYGVCGFWNTGPHEKLAVIANELFVSCKQLTAVPTVAYVISGPDIGKMASLEPSHDYQDDNPNSCRNTSNGIGGGTIVPKTPTSSIRNTEPTTMVARVAGFGSTLVSVSTVQSAGRLSMACLGLIDKFNGTVAIICTDIRLYDQPSSCHLYATFKAHLSHKSSSCAFWIKSYSESSSKAGLKPSRVRVDDCILDIESWNWCSSTGLLIVNMLAAPSVANNAHNNSWLNEGYGDGFIVSIDIK